MAKIVFTFLIIISILSYSHQQNDSQNATFQYCKGKNECYLDIKEPQCIKLNTISYKSIKASFTNTSFASSASISQVHCGTESEKCLNQAPDEGIEETCTNFTINDSEKGVSCCYMKVSYDKSLNQLMCGVWTHGDEECQIFCRLENLNEEN